MRLVNTHINKDCTRKVLVYVDDNGHYIIQKRELQGGLMIQIKKQGRQFFKHIESAQRAITKWLK